MTCCLSYTGAVWIALTCVAGLWWAAPTVAVELDVLPDHADAQPLAIESVASGFGSFAEVSEAVEAERQRITALETRLKELEQKTAPESLPTSMGT